MVETLAYQARERLTDLLWQPVETRARCRRSSTRCAPDAVIVDHLAFSARLALPPAASPHADVVLGHPTALPVGDEVYGLPAGLAGGVQPDPAALARAARALRARRATASPREWNAALAVLDPRRRAVALARSPSTATLLLLNYPGELHDPARTALLPPHAFLGSAVRDEPPTPRSRRGSPRAATRSST